LKSVHIKILTQLDKTQLSLINAIISRIIYRSHCFIQANDILHIFKYLQNKSW